MANEVTVKAELAQTRGGITLSRESGNIQRDAGDDAQLATTQSIGDSAELVVLGDVAMGGYVWLRNRASSGVISCGGTAAIAGGSDPMPVLAPGDISLVKLGSSTSGLYAVSSVAGAVLEYYVTSPE